MIPKATDEFGKTAGRFANIARLLKKCWVDHYSLEKLFITKMAIERIIDQRILKSIHHIQST